MNTIEIFDPDEPPAVSEPILRRAVLDDYASFMLMTKKYRVNLAKIFVPPYVDYDGHPLDEVEEVLP